VAGAAGRVLAGGCGRAGWGGAAAPWLTEARSPMRNAFPFGVSADGGTLALVLGGSCAVPGGAGGAVGSGVLTGADAVGSGLDSAEGFVDFGSATFAASPWGVAVPAGLVLSAGRRGAGAFLLPVGLFAIDA
jgi:hypothetical protein